MSYENTLDENLISLIGEVELPEGEIQKENLNIPTMGCYTLHC